MMTRLLPLLACCLLLAPPLGAQAPPPAPPALQDLGARTAGLAAQLYAAVARTSDDSVLLGPYALALGLAALGDGARGDTRDQLLQALGIGTLDPDTLPELFQSLRSAVAGGGELRLAQAVALLPGKQFSVAPDYKAAVQIRYGATAQNLDYDVAQAAKDTINQLAERGTGDKVRDVVAAVPPQTQMMLVAAASFQGQFSLPFNASDTQDERFYVSKYQTVMVPMMFRCDRFLLAYDRALHLGVLRLGLAGGAAMLVLLPDEGEDIAAVDEQITAERFHGWLRQLKKTWLEVLLPRFSVEGSSSLRGALAGLGVSRAFQEDADLSAISAETGLRLSEVRHKVVFAVDETISGSPPPRPSAPPTLPPRLTINRPFLFITYHEQTSTILFIGRVVNPAKK